MRNYKDQEFFDHPFRGANSVINAVFGEKDFSQIPPAILQAAGERGTAVHIYIEQYLNFLASPEKYAEPHLPLEYAIYETMWKKWQTERTEIGEIVLTEQKIISKKLGFKGVIDCVGYFKEKDSNEYRMCMVDWKTSSMLDLFRTQCQLQLYYELLAQGTHSMRAIAKEIKEIRCLSLTKNEYRWFKFPIDRNLGKSIIYLYNTQFRAEAERRGAPEKITLPGG